MTKMWDELHSEESLEKAVIPLLSPTGSSASLDGSTVMGGYTGLFVGGLPQGHTILQKRLGEFHRKQRFILFQVYFYGPATQL